MTLMTAPKGLILDDRDQQHELSVRRCRKRLSGFERRAFRKWRERTGEWRRGFLVCVGILSAFTAAEGISSPDIRLVLLSIMLIVVLVLGWLLWPGGDDEHTVAMLRAMHRCAACGDDLSRVATADDECRVCPSCSAAWRFEREPVDFDREFPHRTWHQLRYGFVAAEDANGKGVWLSGFDPFKKKSDILTPQESAAVVLALERGRSRYRWMSGFGAASGMAAITILWVGFANLRTSGWSVGCVPWLVVAFGLSIVWYPLHNAASRRKWLLALPVLCHFQRCLSCGYPLAAVPSDERGARTCSECGYAWKFN